MAVLEALPDEILSIIINATRCLNKLAPYSSVSRRWQAMIEDRTMRKLTIRSFEFDQFAALFNGSNFIRWKLLKNLHIIFVLPSYSDGPGCCEVERIPDRNTDSQSFTATLLHLFSILSTVECTKDNIRECNLHLHFNGAYRESTANPPHTYNTAPCTAREHNLDEVQEARSQFGQFEVSDGTSLPEVQSIRTFSFTHRTALSGLKSLSVAKILRVLPNVQETSFVFADDYTWGLVRRQERRHELSRAIPLLLRESLRNLKIKCPSPYMLNEKVSIHKLIGPESWSSDLWYSSLVALMKLPALEDLHLEGLVTVQNVFKSITSSKGQPFPALRRLTIEFLIETADGKWFFRRDNDTFRQAEEDPNYAEFWHDRRNGPQERLDPDVDMLVFGDGPVSTSLVRRYMYRTIPDPSTFREFLLDAAKAVGRMHHLRAFNLRLDRSEMDISPYNWLSYPFLLRMFDISYVKSGFPNFRPEIDMKEVAALYERDKSSVTWRVGAWRPWDDVQTCWRELAGQDSHIVFIEEKMVRKEVERVFRLEKVSRTRKL